MGVLVLWVIALTALTESWESPFGYRKGDFVSRGIDSRVEFGRIDAEETERRARDAEDRVPLVFRNDATGILRLPERLRADLGEISAAETMDDVSTATRNAFGFGPDVPTDSAVATFEMLRKAVEPQGPLSTEARIKDVVSELGKFLTPLMESGVINPDDIRRLELTRSSPIACDSVAIGRIERSSRAGVAHQSAAQRSAD